MTSAENRAGKRSGPRLALQSRTSSNERVKAAPPIIPAETARHLLLGGAGLLEDPDRPASAARVLKQIERMGFVQVDTINTVERAHQHILLTRFDRYRPATLTRLLERERTLFEHWTHDASIIPIGLYPQWRYRFERAKQPDHRLQSWVLRKIGRDANRVIKHVLERIEKEGPLMSRDFEELKSARTKERGEGWWNWKPHKAALEYLWRIGELSISARSSFQKVYELSSRWLPEHHEQPPPSQDEHLDWACREALERLVIATPRELQQFWLAVGIDSARRWCKEAIATGEVIEVELASADGSKSRKAIAKPDWKRRAARLAAAPRRIRLLNPFDPAIRDRQRTLRLFDFEYAFEAFVPESKRRCG